MTNRKQDDQVTQSGAVALEESDLDAAVGGGYKIKISPTLDQGLKINKINTITQKVNQGLAGDGSV